MITLHRVSKSFDGKPVLQALDWHIEPASCWQITGASGIGKTTLLRLVTGLETPDSGTVSAAGVRFCPVFQEDRLVEPWSAVQNVRLVCSDAAQAACVLSELLPADALHQPVRTLSGGMRRRVALARALAAQGDVLVLDEPFAGLDAQTAASAAEVLRRRRGERAVLLVSHGTESLFSDWENLSL